MSEQIEIDEATGWRRLCRVDEIVDRRGRPLMLKGTEIALMRDGEAVYALGGVCPHKGGQIADGTVVNGTAVCPLHLWDFDLRSGISPFNPEDTLPAYPTRIVDGYVEIDADAVPRGAGRPDVYLGRWLRRGATDRGMEIVHGLAAGGREQVDSMGSQRFDTEVDQGRRYPTIDDLVFSPAQVARAPLMDDVEVQTAVTLGTRAGRPLHIAVPMLVSHMSFGALSIEAKVALAAGAKAVGTAIGSGEGGMHPDERAAAGTYIMEMASGYFGWSEEAIARADGLELKFGQGAKPGLGGLLPGKKVTPEIAKVRGLAPGEDAHSPAHFPDIFTPEDLRRKITELRTLTDVPIGVKFASGDVEADVAAAVEAGADWITVDGMGGGTGAAPVHIRENVGLPGFIGLYRARKWLEERGIDDVQVIATGGYRTPAEIAKALALGADAVALATASMMAIGCQQYRACHRGTCPVGIATQRQDLRMRLDPQVSAGRLERYLTAATDMITDYCRAAGKDAVAALARTDLVTLHPDLAERTDIRYML